MFLAIEMRMPDKNILVKIKYFGVFVLDKDSSVDFHLRELNIYRKGLLISVACFLYMYLQKVPISWIW